MYLFNFTVRKVQKIGTKEYYAVKGISKAKIKGHEDELLSEIASWRSLSGSLNVVKLYSVYEDHYNVYILMEICAGNLISMKDFPKRRMSMHKSCSAVSFSSFCLT